MEQLPWYEQSVEEVSYALNTDKHKGLTTNEVQARLNKYGPNELEQKKGPGIFQMFLAQLKDFMVLILLAASLVSLLVNEIADSLVIIGIVIINAVLVWFRNIEPVKRWKHCKRCRHRKQR